MKAELKVGERCVVYATLFGTPVRTKATVLQVEEKRLRVDPGGDDLPFWAHHRQCRRLRKKVRREWEMSRDACGVLRMMAFDKDVQYGETIRVREVKKL